MKRTRSLATLLVVPIVMGLALTGCTRFGATLNRRDAPVVLDGSALPKLIGTAPQHVVGFSWDGKQWNQIPVQVDQRDLVNPGQILNRPAGAYAKLPDGTPYKILVYTNPGVPSPGYTWWPTFSGVAGHTGLGANDEVSFLSNDTGQRAPVGIAAPVGVNAASLEQVLANDTLATNQRGYVYLFSSSTLTGGGAGTTGVNYTFSLDSGNYEATYHMGAGANPPNNTTTPNPEHSSVVTPAYSQTMGDRWLNNGLSITTPQSTGANILERSRVQLVPSTCGRSEDTFDNVIPSSPYEAGFIVNISGPVRAIRSSMGANSGQYTVDTDVFYPQREDSTVDLRVHEIPGAMLFNDFKTGTTGLRYSDSNTTAGVSIDGHTDSVSAALATWQMVSGPQGSLVTTHSVSTDITGLQTSTYYLDQSPALPTPCTGDAAAWGQSGQAIVGSDGGNLPCTDPTICGSAAQPANRYRATSFRYFEVPGFTSTAAATLGAETQTPLQLTVSPTIG